MPADANYDGKVDFADLVALARHYGMSNANFSDGDFNGDGNVGFDDLVVLARNYGLGAGSAAATAGLSPSLGDQILRLTRRSRKRA